jgi:hypothetical protein
VVPADVDAVALAAAIEAKRRASAGSLSERDSSRLDVLQRTSNGRLVVTQAVLKRLGGGNTERGKRFLKQVMNEISNREVKLRADRLFSRNYC